MQKLTNLHKCKLKHGITHKGNFAELLARDLSVSDSLSALIIILFVVEIKHR